MWEAEAILGEGPVWSAREARLYWLDIRAALVMRFDPMSGTREVFAQPVAVTCLAPRRVGGFVAGTASGFAFVQPERGVHAVLVHPERELRGNRFNDGACDELGRFHAGTMDDACVAPTGALYRLDADRSVRRLDDGYVVTNGPAFALDGRTLFHNDSTRGLVYAFERDPASGELGARRVFARFEGAEGLPDGMTVDAEGCLWIAHWGGARVTRRDPDGKLERTLALPVAHVTSVAFGGAELDRLYVTTAREGLTADALRAQPLAGGLFELEPGVRGVAAREFAG